MTVSLNIDSQSIRLVSQQANRISIWETLELPAGSCKDGLILNPQVVAEMLKEQFHALKLSSQPVKVCLTGLSFIYRVITLPNLKNLNLKSAVEKATQKEIALPIGNLYLDWQIIRRTKRELDVFVMGINRSMVDVLGETFKLAGLNIRSLELKALALTRAAGRTEALIIDCERSAFEILIVRKGVPVAIHRVTPKNTMSTFEDNLDQMITELHRTIDFFNLNNNGEQINQATPVILSGSLCDSAAAHQAISRMIGYCVEDIAPVGNRPTSFPVSTYAANLGLLINSAQNDGIDLVRARRRALSRPVSIKNVALICSISAALILLALVWVIRQQAVNQTASLQLRSESLNQEMIVANQKLQITNRIQNNIRTLKIQNQQLETERQTLAGKGELSVILKTLTYDLPAGTFFTQISAQTEKIDLDGRTQHREDIINYIHALEKSRLFSDVRLALLNNEGNPSGIDYTFKIIILR
jgi:Tfp pilus assembly PilM family ATPase/Tfp pilus assembly protein PilN